MARYDEFGSDQQSGLLGGIKKHNKLVLGTLVVLVIALFISTIALAARGPKIVDNNVTPSPPTPATLTCDNIAPSERYSCNPEPNGTEASCKERGCCYQADADKKAPTCFFPRNYDGYLVKVLSESKFQLVAELKRNRASGFLKDVALVSLVVTFVNENLIRLKFVDPTAQRYEVILPDPIKLDYNQDYQKFVGDVKIDDKGVLTVTRKSTKKELIRTDLQRLIYSDQYLQIDWKLPSDKIIGLSEHYSKQFRKDVSWSKWTVFNRGDQPKDAYTTPSLNLYGQHPMYLMTDDDTGSAHGVFLLNSNAMDIMLQPEPSIQWRVIGGVLDFFVYMGPGPKDVVKQHAALMGKTFMPPYWALGFHLARYGYNSSEKTIEVYNRTIEAGIPLDVQWNDIDAFDHRDDFTYNKVNFSDLPQHIRNLNAAHRHWMIILDPGVSNSHPSPYPPYDDGAAVDIFVKNASGQNLEGKVWNDNLSVYVDFTNPKAWTYWTRQARRFHKDCPFSGLWVDMNEPTSFVDGSIYGCPDNNIENPPYTPGNDPLRKVTACMTAQGYIGNHYDTHSLYPHYESAATAMAVRSITGQRPFVLSRANFAGHGQYAAHWTGDIDSSYDHMRWSITGIMEFNIYGVGMIGADICGFQHNTTEDLCARWQALGSFYPFSRNHNDHDTIEQDPVALGDTVVNATKKALELRYRLLPHLYTLFHEAHTTGEPVIRPLFFEFSADKDAYVSETQFMWGSGVMIVPAMTNDTKQDAYFPDANWRDIRTFELLSAGKEHKTLDIPITDIVVAIRGGSIIPTQDPMMTTFDSRLQPFRLLGSLDSNSKATGQLYWDDGVTDNTYQLGLYNLITFTVENKKLTSTVFKGVENSTMPLAEVIMLNVVAKPASIQVNGKDDTNFDYDADTQRLNVRLSNIDLQVPFSVEWK